MNSLQLHFWTIIDQSTHTYKINVIQSTQDYNIHLFNLFVFSFPTDEADAIFVIFMLMGSGFTAEGKGEKGGCKGNDGYGSDEGVGQDCLASSIRKIKTLT